MPVVSGREQVGIPGPQERPHETLSERCSAQTFISGQKDRSPELLGVGSRPSANSLFKSLPSG